MAFSFSSSIGLRYAEQVLLKEAVVYTIATRMGVNQKQAETAAYATSAPTDKGFLAKMATFDVKDYFWSLVWLLKPLSASLGLYLWVQGHVVLEVGELNDIL